MPVVDSCRTLSPAVPLPGARRRRSLSPAAVRGQCRGCGTPLQGCRSRGQGLGHLPWTLWKQRPGQWGLKAFVALEGEREGKSAPAPAPALSEEGKKQQQRCERSEALLLFCTTEARVTWHPSGAGTGQDLGLWMKPPECLGAVTRDVADGEAKAHPTAATLRLTQV